MLVAMTCAVSEKLTEQYYMSVLTFTVLLTCVGTGLCCGAVTVAAGAHHGPSGQLLDPAVE